MPDNTKNMTCSMSTLVSWYQDKYNVSCIEHSDKSSYSEMSSIQKV